VVRFSSSQCREKQALLNISSTSAAPYERLDLQELCMLLKSDLRETPMLYFITCYGRSFFDIVN
jgi:hypothetical protein